MKDPLLWRRVAGAFLALLSCAAVVAQAPRRIVYVLAGQSNIARLAHSANGCGSGVQRPNVRYYAIPDLFPYMLTGPTATAEEPLMELGTQLGVHHAQDNVDIVMIAQSGSSLLMRNQAGAPYGFWFDETNWTNQSALATNMYVLLGQLGTSDELHIVWGQGETDAAAPVFNTSLPVTTRDEYSLWARHVFAILAAGAQHASYRVHLVTLGAIEHSWQPGGWVEHIRDAYLDLERIPVPVFGFAPPIASVAHHFDLPHVDSYHLTPCGYVLLAKRIADGIIGPSLQPKAVDLSSAGIVVQSNTRLAVPVTTDLKPLAITSAPAVTKYFDVRINGGGMAAIQVEVAATAPRELRIWVPAGGLLTATSIDVRHIHGSGDGQAWGAAVSLIAAAHGSAPLEPFVIRR